MIAYYTRDTPYEGEAEVLRLSLESMEYSYLICEVPNLGSWQRNTQFKAPFIQQILGEHPGQPLLYLDVDAVMLQPPSLLDNLKADIAAVHFAKPGGELLTGTLWLGNTVQCGRIVKKWIHFNILYPDTLPNGRAAWDQRTLAWAIKQVRGVNFVELPQEYTYIVELTQRRCPNLNPVILHTRGAKRFRNIVDNLPGFAE